MTTATKKGGTPELGLEVESTVNNKTAAVVKSGAPPAASIEHAAPSGVASVHQLLQLAIEKGAGIDALERLMTLHERASDRQAREDFNRAFAAFREECPQIHKSKTAKINTKKGGQYSYSYAPLDVIARTVDPILANHGFSYGWDSKVESKALTCICTLRHVNGHSVTSSFTLPVENDSAMSPQQMVGAALTFAQRYTLVSVLGLKTTEEDTDAVAREVDPTPIDEDQATHLEDLIKEVKVDRVRFLRYLDVEKLEELPAARYQEAIAALEEKRQRRAR